MATKFIRDARWQRASRIDRGERTHLRRPRSRDRAAFLELTRASVELHRPWVSPPTSDAAFRVWLRECRARNRERTLLCANDDGRLLGYFGLGEIVIGNLHSAYLGYWVGAPHAGRGYMDEGLELILRYIFARREQALHRVEANIQPENRRSIELVRRHGFRHEGFSPGYLIVDGRWRDHERWAITVEQWRARDRPRG